MMIELVHWHRSWFESSGQGPPQEPEIDGGSQLCNSVNQLVNMFRVDEAKASVSVHMPEVSNAIDENLMQLNFDAQISVLGFKLQKKMEDAKVLLVAAGAIGCEFLKNLTLIGVWCSMEYLKNLNAVANVSQVSCGEVFTSEGVEDKKVDESMRILCMESAYLKKPIILQPGEEWKGAQTLYVVLSSYCTLLQGWNNGRKMRTKCRILWKKKRWKAKLRYEDLVENNELIRGIYRGLTLAVLALLLNWVFSFKAFDQLKCLLHSYASANHKLSTNLHIQAASSVEVAIAITSPLYEVLVTTMNCFQEVVRVATDQTKESRDPFKIAVCLKEVEKSGTLQINRVQEFITLRLEVKRHETVEVRHYANDRVWVDMNERIKLEGSKKTIRNWKKRRWKCGIKIEASKKQHNAFKKSNSLKEWRSQFYVVVLASTHQNDHAFVTDCRVQPLEQMHSPLQ